MELNDWIRAARKLKKWTQTQLGDALDVTKGNVSAWELGRHQPSFSQLQKISNETGLPLPILPQPPAASNSLDNQFPPSARPLPHLNEGGIAHPMSYQNFETVPSLSWEQLMDTDPQGKFMVTLPDGAMAPRARAGDECVFIGGQAPAFGAGVLVKDSTGRVYFRRYIEAPDGAFEAAPENPSYLTLHSSRDELRVIAVLRGVMRGWEDL